MLTGTPASQTINQSVPRLSLSRTLFALTSVILAAAASLGAARAHVFDHETTTRTDPGVYLSPPGQPTHVTTPSPMADLSLESVQRLFAEHPELHDHKVVLVLPSLLKGRALIHQVKEALEELGIPPEIEVIRRPSGFFENILDFLPRKQDWQRPIPSEISTGHVMVFGGEILSMSLFAYLAIVQLITPETALAATALDLTQQALLTYPVRSISNYFNRQSNARQLLANFLIGAIEASNFFLVFNANNLQAALPTYFASAISGGVLAVLWGNSTIAAFKWEYSPQNKLPLDTRRTFRTYLLFALQMVLSPFYIYSLTPPDIAPVLMHTPVLDLNAGHFVIGGAGLLAAAAFPLIHRIASMTSRIFC